MQLVTNEWARLAWMQLWQVTLLAVAVAVGVRLFARRRPHAAYVLWMLVIAKCLTPPLWASPFGLFSRIQTPTAANRAAAMSAAPSDMSESPRAVLEMPDARFESTRPTTLAASEPATIGPAPVGFNWASLALGTATGIWFAGALAVCGVIVWKWAAFRRHLRQLATPAGAEIDRRVRSLAEQMAVRAIPRVLVLRESLAPAVFGVFRPTILLPETLSTSDRGVDLDAILAHELVHIRRRDPFASSLQLIAQALWWFHPLVWWANREARHERERCCDEAVVTGLNCPPISYASTLVSVAELAAGAGRVAAVAMIGPSEATAMRLEHITGTTRQFRKRTPLSYLVAAALLGAMVLPGAALVPGAAEPPADTSLLTNPDSPGKTISIAGVCVDSNQRPLEGVRVFLVPHLSDTERGTPCEVRTAADGRFRFNGVPAPFRNRDGLSGLLYCVIGRKAGWATEMAWVPLPDSTPRQELRLKLVPAASLKGHVTDRQGKPVAGATVWTPRIQNPIPGVWSAKTDDQGSYEIADLAPWPAKHLPARLEWGLPFRVACPGYGTASATYSEIPVAVDVVLEGEAMIEGNVVDTVSGKPAANVPVTCQGVKRFGWEQATTDRQGHYRLRGLAADKYVLYPDAADRTAVAIESPDIEPGKTTHVSVLKLIEGGFLEGRLIDAVSGKPISKQSEGVDIQFGVFGPAREPVHSRGGTFQSAMVDENGMFRMRVAPGVNRLSIVNHSEIWQRVQRREEFEGLQPVGAPRRGITVAEGQTVQLVFRIRPRAAILPAAGRPLTVTSGKSLPPAAR
jgi:beta-lactamase regulating signal transducer with metallopeptidase domain